MTRPQAIEALRRAADAATRRLADPNADLVCTAGALEQTARLVLAELKDAKARQAKAGGRLSGYFAS